MSWKEENKRHGQLTFFDVLFSKKQEKRKEKKENQNKSEKKRET